MKKITKSDMAAIGNVLHELHTKALPRTDGLKGPAINKGNGRAAGKGMGSQGSSAGRGMPPMQGNMMNDNDGDE